MHMIYKTIWLLSEKICKHKISKKDLFLIISVIFWSMVFMAGYFICTLAPSIPYNLNIMISGIIFSGIGLGFFGGVMYIFRNTTPKDL